MKERKKFNKKGGTGFKGREGGGEKLSVREVELLGLGMQRRKKIKKSSFSMYFWGEKCLLGGILRKMQGGERRGVEESELGRFDTGGPKI